MTPIENMIAELRESAQERQQRRAIAIKNAIEYAGGAGMAAAAYYEIACHCAGLGLPADRHFSDEELADPAALAAALEKMGVDGLAPGLDDRATRILIANIIYTT